MHRFYLSTSLVLLSLCVSSLSSAQNAPAVASTTSKCVTVIDPTTNKQVTTCTEQIPGGQASSVESTQSNSWVSPDGSSSEESTSYSSSSSVVTTTTSD